MNINTKSNSIDTCETIKPGIGAHADSNDACASTGGVRNVALVAVATADGSALRRRDVMVERRIT